LSGIQDCSFFFHISVFAPFSGDFFVLILSGFHYLPTITGIGKVETDNLVEDYQYRLNQLKITPFQAQAEPTDAGQEAAPVADSQEPLK